MIHYLILCVLFFCFSKTKAQSKKFTNEIAYKVDDNIYKFEFIEGASDIEIARKIIMDEDKKSVKKIKELHVVENIFLVRDTTKKTAIDFLFEAEEGQVLGPFSSEYGAYRFVKIDDSSNKSRSTAFANDYSLDYGGFFLSNKKGTKRQLELFSKQLMTFYETGKRYNLILKKLKKFKSTERGSGDFMDLPNNKKKVAALEAGAHYVVLERPDGLGVFLLQKRTKGYESVRYTEYIFK